MATYTNKNGTNKADILTYTKSSKSFKAGAGNDKITVKTGSSITVNGEAGNDTITIKSGKNHIIYGGTGADKVIVNGGTVKLVDLGASYDKKYMADEFTINGGTVTKLKLGTGAFKSVTINGGRVSTIQCTSANGVVTADDKIDNGDIFDIVGGSVGTIKGSAYAQDIWIGAEFDKAGKKISQGKVTKADLGGGNDILSVDAGSVATALMGAGVDTLKVKGGTVTTADMGSGNDVVKISGGVVTTLKLGAGNDKVTVTGGKVSALNLGSGNDVVSISGLTSSIKVTADSGYNTITIEKSKSVKVEGADNITEKELIAYDKGTLTNKAALERVKAYFAGTLKGDKITVKKTNTIDVNGGVGNDVITLSGKSVSSSTIHVGDADDGNDTIRVSNAMNASIAGGNGDDKYIIDWQTVGHVEIRNFNDPWVFKPNGKIDWEADSKITKEKDTLQLTGVNSTDVVMKWVKNFDNQSYHGQVSAGSLRISDINNADHFVDVIYWKENPLASITFDNKTMSYGDIKKVL